MFNRALEDLVRLVTNWWRVDRIRVSPNEGRLLRLTPPCVVVVEARPAEVLARTAGWADAGPLVVYDCRSVRGPCQMRVVPRGLGLAPSVHWIEDGIEREVAADDVETYQATRSSDGSRPIDDSTLETSGLQPYG